MSSRNRFLFLIITLYILPVVVLSLYASLFFTSSHSFGILSIGVLLTVAGSTLIYLFDKREKPQQTPLFTQKIVETSLPLPEIDTTQLEEQQALIGEYQKELSVLSRQNDALSGAIEELTKAKEGLEKKIESADHDFRLFQENTKQQQEQTQQLLHEHQKTIHEQRETLEKKQQLITQQEGQIRDLHYEIKTLMEVEERQSIIRFPMERQRQREFDFTPSPPEDQDTSISPPQVHCPDEASQQLKRCLDIAQKITGGQYMQNKPSRLKDLPVENTALEMRRLFDNLRSENQATILLYSPKDKKMLFVNNPIKSILGWTPEKFVNQFQDLLIDGGDSWAQSIKQLAFKNESRASLLFSAKSGQHIALNCHLGLIPTGSFRHFVLGVLYLPK